MKLQRACIVIVGLFLLVPLAHAQPELKAWQLVDLYLKKGTGVWSRGGNDKTELKSNELIVKNCLLWRSVSYEVACVYSDHPAFPNNESRVYESDLVGYHVLKEAIYSDYEYDEWELKDFKGAWGGEAFLKKLIENFKLSKKRERREFMKLAHRYKLLLGEVELLKRDLRR